MVLHTGLRWARRGIGIVYPVTAVLPAVLVLSHPMPVAWLRPLCKDTWTILAVSALAAVLPSLFRCKKASASSLLVIALTQAIFQGWCYNTGSHPAHNPFQMWGILPGSDAVLYYTAASDLLNGQQITAMAGARHPYPLLLALLLKIFGHDLRSVTLVFTIVMAVATWSAFEVIRRRLGGLAAAVYLACVTFYIRIHCTGLFMTEQLGLLYSLCAVGMLVGSLASGGKAKTWLYCGGLFFLTQALNARPAAYMILPFLVFASWELCQGNFKTKGRMVGLSAVAVATSFFLHSVTYYWVVASPTPSNAWFSIYGLLNEGTWVDGRNHTEELLRNNPSLASANRQQGALIYAQGLRVLREECLTEISHHPGKLLRGWWRALRFLWSKNTPFRAVYPQMPSVWFTESVRWCAVLGLAFSVFFLLRGGSLTSNLRVYRALSWLNLAALLGMIFSLPFAPPWDGETRIFAATLPLFFLLPASGVGAFYLSIVNKFHEFSPESKPESQPKIAIGSAAVVGGTLSIAIISASWCLAGTSSAAKNRRHPVELMVDQLRVGEPSVSSFDLRSLKAGYHLHVTGDTRRTWLPNISRKDFIRNCPGGVYVSLSPKFKQSPPGTEIVVLPYWILLVLDKEDAHTQTFTPLPEQTGHLVWPPVYFSKRLHVEVP
jgi:Dolichyl-phosphate-mannose-protein mannosyltransferase